MVYDAIYEVIPMSFVALIAMMSVMYCCSLTPEFEMLSGHWTWSALLC